MITLSLTMECTHAEKFRHQSTPKIKFNPASKTLSDRISGLRFSIGKGDAGLTLDIPNFGTLGTGIKANEDAFSEKIIWGATASGRWIKLPTIADYENLDELNDVEQTENLIYQASKRFTW